MISEEEMSRFVAFTNNVRFVQMQPHFDEDDIDDYDAALLEVMKPQAFESAAEAHEVVKDLIARARVNTQSRNWVFEVLGMLISDDELLQLNAVRELRKTGKFKDRADF